MTMRLCNGHGSRPSSADLIDLPSQIDLSFAVSKLYDARKAGGSPRLCLLSAKAFKSGTILSILRQGSLGMLIQEVIASFFQYKTIFQ